MIQVLFFSSHVGHMGFQAKGPLDRVPKARVSRSHD
jgi:hypothetical protein